MSPAHVEAEKNIKTAVVNKKLVSADSAVLTNFIQTVR